MAIIDHYTLQDEPVGNGWRRVVFVYVETGGREFRHGPMELPEGTDLDAVRAQIAPELEEMLRQREIEANVEQVVG